MMLVIVFRYAVDSTHHRSIDKIMMSYVLRMCFTLAREGEIEGLR